MVLFVPTSFKSLDHHAEHHEYAEFGEPGDHEDHGNEEEEHNHDDVHQHIGLSLLTGFILMVIIDHLGGSHGHSHGDDSSTLVAEKSIENGGHAESKASTATIGLVVHAAADGLALGAAGASEVS